MVEHSSTIQTGNPLPALNMQQKETLLMMIVLNFAEDKNLLNAEQLEDARASLRAMFLRATGEETMLRKMIGILKLNHSLNRTFNQMVNVLEVIGKSHKSLADKLAALKKKLGSMDISVEENNDFVGSLLDFSNDFLRNVGAFERQMIEYREVMENQARTAHVFELAKEARARLKSRFEEAKSEDTEHDERIKKKVYQSFNYADAESEYHFARRSAERTSKEIRSILRQFNRMCQMARKPEMREVERIEDANERQYPDIYTITSAAMYRHPRMKDLLPMIQDLMKMYQHSYGMFKLDFKKFNQAIEPMTRNTEDYFLAKEQDEDFRTKQEKLRYIESLIALIENISGLLKDGKEYAYPAFSNAVTAAITRTDSKWADIAEDLLRMKVGAEAELSTRIS